MCAVTQGLLHPPIIHFRFGYEFVVLDRFSIDVFQLTDQKGRKAGCT